MNANGPCSIREHLPSTTKLHFILGSELEFKGKTNPPHLKGRHHIHKKYNDLAKQVAERYDNTDVFDINEFVTEQSDFRLNQIHYSREVYYKMAKKMSEIISAGNTAIPLGFAQKLRSDCDFLGRHIGFI